MTDDPRPGFNALRDAMLNHVTLHRDAKPEDLTHGLANMVFEALYRPAAAEVAQPCPFCGTEHPSIHGPTCTQQSAYDPADRAFPIVQCRSCHAEVPGKDWDGSCQSAIDAWNRRAALAAPKAEAWQPIETAPKDGSMFLCWVQAVRWNHPDGGGSGIERDVSQVDFCWWRVAPESPDGGYFDAACGQIGDGQDVTHWMPLPKPPSTPAHQGATHE